MSDEQIKELLGGLPLAVDYLVAEMVSKAQAEISFKAGQKVGINEVVEWNMRHIEIEELRRQGLSMAEIGRRLGISRQRVSFVLNPKPPPAIQPSKPMLRTQEAAQLLGIHVNTIRRWNSLGILKSYIISTRGDRRFKRTDLERFLKKRSTKERR